MYYDDHLEIRQRVMSGVIKKSLKEKHIAKYVITDNLELVNDPQVLISYPSMYRMLEVIYLHKSSTIRNIMDKLNKNPDFFDYNWHSVSELSVLLEPFINKLYEL